MAFLDENPPTLDSDLEDLVDEYLEDMTLGEVIEILAAKLEDLRAEEADHDRTIDAGGEAEGE